MAVILIFLFLLFILYSFSGQISGLEGLVLFSGFFIVVSFYAGKFLKKLGLPLITGYLITGIIFSPSISGVLSEKLLEYFKYVNEIALSFIAFAAGAELKIDSIKKRLKSIWIITFFQVLIVFVSVSSIFFFIFLYTEIIKTLSTSYIITMSILLGVIATAKSPATTIAVILEEKAKGEMTDTVLGITIIKDVLIMFIFSIAFSLSVGYLKGGGTEKIYIKVAHLSAEIVLSVLIGVVVYFVVYAYMKVVSKYVLLFLFSVSLILSGLYYEYEIHFLLTCITAGFLMRNFTKYGEEFLKAVDEVSLPVIIIFFSVSGASVKAGVFKRFWYIALLYVLVRAIFTFLGTYIGGVVSKAADSVKKYSWYGFLGQAGVSIGFAQMIGKEFSSVGELIKSIVLAGIIVNQIIGPVGFSWALRKTSEAKNYSK